jgi:hypothetical protein
VHHRRLLVVLALAFTVGGVGIGGADGRLTALGRVRAIAPGPRLCLALSSGYGYSGAVLDNHDRHHRAVGAAAIAVRPQPWLELGGELVGRYDRTTGATPDDGLIGDPRWWVGAGGAIDRHNALGVRVGVWLPGADAPSVKLSATSIDAALVWSHASPATTITIRVGGRYDRSTESVDASTLSPADRVGLGWSDANAVSVGFGVDHRVAGWQAVGEVSGDLLIGAGAPSALHSPWRVGLGARRALDAAFTLETMVEISLSQRPDRAAMANQPLVAVEPRLAIALGLSWHPAPARAARVLVAPPPPPEIVIAPPRRPRATLARCQCHHRVDGGSHRRRRRGAHS